MRAMLADPLLDAKQVGDTRIASVRMNLARALRNQGKFGEALPLARSAAGTSERVFGADHYQTLIQRSTVADILDTMGNCPDALPIQRDVARRMAARFGETKQGTLIETGNLGLREYNCGDRATGITLLRKVESSLREHYGQDNAAAQSFRLSLAEALIEQRRSEEARRLLDGIDPRAMQAAGGDPGEVERLRGLLPPLS